MTTLTIGNRINWEIPDLLDAGVQPIQIGAALKAVAITATADRAEGYRARLASIAPGKMAEHLIKEAIAADPTVASEDELALLSREAKARGTNRTGLIGMINKRAAANRQIMLLVGVIEAETKAAISEIADDAPDIEQAISAILKAASASAEEAFNEAQQIINGET